MKKKTNKLISDWLLPIIGVGSIFLIFFNLDKLTFVPDISFCSSYQFILCDIPIFASGGVSNIDDIKKLKQLKNGITGVIVGKAFYEGKIKIEEMLKC